MYLFILTLLPLYVTGQTCTDLTVYSVCNSGNPVIGIYNSIVGTDSNGYSKYLSANNYHVYYDVQTKVSMY